MQLELLPYVVVRVFTLWWKEICTMHDNYYLSKDGWLSWNIIIILSLFTGKIMLQKGMT